MASVTHTVVHCSVLLDWAEVLGKRGSILIKIYIASVIVPSTQGVFGIYLWEKDKRR